MLSRLIPNVDLITRTMTSTVVQKQKTPSPGESIKLHIPELMTKIPVDDAKITSVQTRGKNIFLNASECRPSVKSTLKTQNFITVTCGKNANWDGIDLVIKDDSGRIVSRILPKHLQVQCKFISGNINHGTVETTRDIKSYDGQNKAENTSMLYSGDMGHVHVTDPEQISILSDHVDNLITRLQDSKIIGKK